MTAALIIAAAALVLAIAVANFVFGWYLPRQDREEAGRLEAEERAEWADVYARYREDGRLDCWCRYCRRDWTAERGTAVVCPNCGNAPAVEAPL